MSRGSPFEFENVPVICLPVEKTNAIQLLLRARSYEKLDTNSHAGKMYPSPPFLFESHTNSKSTTDSLFLSFLLRLSSNDLPR